MAAKMAEQLKKLEAKFPTYSRGPILYTDQDITNLAQDYAAMKMSVQPPPPKGRKRISGKWWEIGDLERDEVDDHGDTRLQHYFDLASQPNSRINYWPLYFAELARHGGSEWDGDDWKKWRIWYFSMHPEQRAVYQVDKASRQRRANQRRWRNMTPEQREKRNAERRRRYAEKRQGK